MDLKSNKKIGNDFERELANILSNKGYWVTFLNPKKYIGSQPADLIVAKNNRVALIDCKTCSNYLFPVSRIEQNQWSASKKFIECGNSDYYIAIKYMENIYIIPIQEINKNEKSINLIAQMKWRL